MKTCGLYRITYKMFVKIIFSVLIVAIMATGCASDRINEIEYELTNGVYEHLDTAISFDLSEERFVITVLGSDFMEGTIQLEKGRVKATTDDGRFLYVFEILDNKIRLIEDESDTLVGVGGNDDTQSSTAGVEFILLDN